MTLSPGTRLDVYEIIALLGAGGMGAVYRARDTRPELAREVACAMRGAMGPGSENGRYRTLARPWHRINDLRVKLAFDTAYDPGHGCGEYFTRSGRRASGFDLVAKSLSSGR